MLYLLAGRLESEGSEQAVAVASGWCLVRTELQTHVRTHITRDCAMAQKLPLPMY